jgi:hypothetical protein
MTCMVKVGASPLRARPGTPGSLALGAQAQAPTLTCRCTGAHRPPWVTCGCQAGAAHVMQGSHICARLCRARDTARPRTSVLGCAACPGSSLSASHYLGERQLYGALWWRLRTDATDHPVDNKGVSGSRLQVCEHRGSDGLPALQASGAVSHTKQHHERAAPGQQRLMGSSAPRLPRGNHGTHRDGQLNSAGVHRTRGQVSCIDMGMFCHSYSHCPCHVQPPASTEGACCMVKAAGLAVARTAREMPERRRSTRGVSNREAGAAPGLMLLQVLSTVPATGPLFHPVCNPGLPCNARLGIRTVACHIVAVRVHGQHGVKAGSFGVRVHLRAQGAAQQPS